MKYVSSPTLAFSLACCLVSPLAPSAFASEQTEPANLSKYLLSDEQIAEKCAASIQSKSNLVTFEQQDGATRQAPKCVQIYEALRTSAEKYTQRVEQAKTQVQNSMQICLEKPNQSNCVAASQAVIRTAVSSHQELGDIASEEANHMGALVTVPAPKREPSSGQDSSDSQNDQS